MILTCLSCGTQVDIVVQDPNLEQFRFCVCGKEHVYPNLIAAGTYPCSVAKMPSTVHTFRAQARSSTG